MQSFLLDTHTVLWYAADSPQLSATSRAVLSSDQSALYISIVTWWEVAIKHSLGKLPLIMPLPALLEDLEYRGFRLLPVQTRHILQLSQLPYPANGHRDPFDRLLIAQAQADNLILLSRDGKFDAYAVQRQF